MAAYLATLWRTLTGTSPRNTFNEADFLGALRPHSALNSPRRLPNTPTSSHRPGRRPEPKDTGKKSKQCPHCRKTFYSELPAGRISKPKGERVGGNRKRKRWVSVRDQYRVEDLSPVVGEHGEDDGTRDGGKMGAKAKGKKGRTARSL